MTESKTTQVWGMLATPFDPAGNIDRASLQKLSRVTVERGCSALVVNGVVAEPATLGLTERLDALDVVLETVEDSVVAAVLTLDPVERISEIAKIQRRFGDSIAGFMVPVDSSDQRRLTDGLRAAADVTDHPLTVQDYPAASGVGVRIDDLIASVGDVPTVQAVKSEAPSTFARIERLVCDVPAVAAMSGLGGIGLVNDLVQGATIAATGLSIPEVIVAACRQWDAGNEVAARRTIDDYASLIWFETHQGTSVAIRKEHWRQQGVLACAGTRHPTTPYSRSLQRLSAAHGFA